MVTEARKQLLDLIVTPDAYDRPVQEILPLQLEAARELFERRREQIPVLRRRAEESDVTQIRSFADLVPLLFSHTVYKSYPPSLVDHGRWDRMLQWLQTLSVASCTDVKVDGVRNVDDWIERLRAAGHYVLATSGSSGKVSFLNATFQDLQTKTRHFANSIGWPYLKPNQDRAAFLMSPSAGPNSAIEAALINARIWSRPDGAHFLTDEPLRISAVSEMAAMRKKMLEGTATPSAFAAFEDKMRERAERGAKALVAFADKLLAHRHEPIVVQGMWAQHLAVINRARELGIGDGEFHPQTYVAAGGGVKGVVLPEDYKQQVDRFYGKVIRGTGYGMTEMTQMMPRCNAQRYHRAPGLIMLILDRTGEHLIQPENGIGGMIEGRFAFLDLAYEGRWGGLISGDKVTVDFAERCPCGRRGPTILDTITRYAQPGEDDHIGCAGTIDAYVRGAMNT